MLIYEVVWLQLLQLVIGLTTASLGILLGTYMGEMRREPAPASAGLRPAASAASLRDVGTRHRGLRPGGALRSADARGFLYRPGRQRLRSRDAPGRGRCYLPVSAHAAHGRDSARDFARFEPMLRGVSWLGFFYAGNIAGATLGCLLAGFYLLRVFNMATATYVAACGKPAVPQPSYPRGIWPATSASLSGACAGDA